MPEVTWGLKWSECKLQVRLVAELLVWVVSMGLHGDRGGSSDLLNGGQTNSGPRLSELLLRVSAGDSGGRKTERADRAQGQEVPAPGF